jgi:cytochrome c oxidase cbb3-type subunit 3/ubiquinol-cytochrome c reductase cytochrome c subunit
VRQARRLFLLSQWREGSWLAFAVLACGIFGCDLPGRPTPADRFVPPREEKEFGALFEKYCAGCHGAVGKLGPAPPLNDKLFLALVPDAELKRVIAEGRAGTLMPAFAEAHGGALAGAQVAVLADGIKKHWGTSEPAPSGAPSYLPAGAGTGSNKAGDPDAGSKVFARACASCHGANGQGGEHKGMTIGAINESDFLALLSDQALRRYVITGRPDLGMPDYADSAGRPREFQPLLAQDVANLTALLVDWRVGKARSQKGK